MFDGMSADQFSDFKDREIEVLKQLGQNIQNHYDPKKADVVEN